MKDFESLTQNEKDEEYEFLTKGLDLMIQEINDFERLLEAASKAENAKV